MSTFDERRERFWKTRDDAKRLIYKMAGHLGPIPPYLQEYFVQAQALRSNYEQDKFDHIASQMGLPELDKLDTDLDAGWIPKKLYNVHKSVPFRCPLGSSGRLSDQLWMKREYVESKDKYRCESLPSAYSDEPSYVGYIGVHYSPRFTVYVRETNGQ